MRRNMRVLAEVANSVYRRLPSRVRQLLAELTIARRMAQAMFGHTVLTRRLDSGITIAYNPFFHRCGVQAAALGKYEPELLRLLARILRPGDVFYDVGAHIGIFALHAALVVGAEGRVVALEPTPQNARYLRLSVHASNLSNVAVVEAAASACSGVAHLALAGALSMCHLTHRKRPHPDDVIPVRTITLDELTLSGAYPPPTLVKIDVEGHAGKVIRGMLRSATLFCPAILCEVHTALGEDVSRDFSPLMSLGYRVATMRREETRESTRFHVLALVPGKGPGSRRELLDLFTEES